MHKQLLEKLLTPKTKKPIEGGNKDRYPVRRTKELSQQQGIRLGKLKHC